MSIRQYIPVKAVADPDPAVFCPPRGYEIPADPNILEPDPEWYPVGNPGNEEIILTCSDGGDRRIAPPDDGSRDEKEEWRTAQGPAACPT